MKKTKRDHAAQALLRKLLPEAQRLVSEGNVEPLRPSSEFGGATAHLYHRDSLRGVEIVGGERGGWLADLVFDVPSGSPSVLGTMVGRPWSTRTEAIAHAVEQVARVLKTDPPANIDPALVFEFHGEVFKIAMSPEQSQWFIGFHCDRDVAEDALQERSERYAAADGSLRSGLSHAELSDITGAIILGLAAEIVRWPQRSASVPNNAPAVN